jgi:hypothetical protein
MLRTANWGFAWPPGDGELPSFAVIQQLE